MGTLLGLHPFSVAVNLITVLPYFPEAVLIDVPLVVVAPDAEASGDGAVGKDGGHIDTSAA